MMDLQKQFEEATAKSKNLSEKPSNEVLLRLYSLYKQATTGDLQRKYVIYYNENALN